MKGISDKELAKHCGENSFVLVTLDKEFANPVNYPSNVHHGIVLLRLSSQERRSVEDLFAWFVKKFAMDNLRKRIIVVGRNSVKIRE